MSVPVPHGIHGIEINMCTNPSPEEIEHLAHFGFFDDDGMPLAMGYITPEDQWIPDQMKTGYAQGMHQMAQRMQAMQQGNNPQGVPPGAQAVEVSPEMSQKIIDMIRGGKSTTDEPMPDSGIGQYL